MTELVQRFQRVRWSDVRQRIDGMVPGFTQRFYRSDRNAVVTAIRRTCSAYGDRRYATRGAGPERKTGPVIVTRLK